MGECNHIEYCSHRAMKKVVEMMGDSEGGEVIGIHVDHWNEIVNDTACDKQDEVLTNGFFMVPAPTGIFLVMPMARGRFPRWLEDDECKEIEESWKRSTQSCN